MALSVHNVACRIVGLYVQLVPDAFEACRASAAACPADMVHHEHCIAFAAVHALHMLAKSASIPSTAMSLLRIERCQWSARVPGTCASVAAAVAGLDLVLVDTCAAAALQEFHAYVDGAYLRGTTNDGGSSVGTQWVSSAGSSTLRMGCAPHALWTGMQQCMRMCFGMSFRTASCVECAHSRPS